MATDSPWPLLVPLSALFLLPLVLYHLLFRSRNGDPAAAGTFPPGPPKQLPVLGNLLQVGSRPHRYFQSVARRYGPVVQVQLGRVRTVVVHSPEAAKDVLRTNDLQCCSRPYSAGAQMLSYNFLDVAFGPYSAYWREMRKIVVVELTSMRRVHNFAHARTTELDHLVDTLAASPAGVPVDISSAMYALSDGIIGTVALGKVYGTAQWSSEQSSLPLQEVMDKMVQVLQGFNFEDFFPSSALARWADVLTGAVWRRRRIFRRIDGFFDMVISKHLEPERLRAGVQEDMVDALVKIWQDQDEANFQFTRDNIKAILLNIFAGGIDTTSVTMTWIMTELMRNPMVMQKAQAEVRNIMKSKPRVDEEDIQNLKYLKMVIKENFRLHPPGTLLVPRQTMQACMIGGYSVPSGTRVHINVWAMGRDPSIWNNPEEFYPERFEDTHVDFRGSHFELLPFGSGRRGCPGIAMAMVTVELVLANLLYCFDWEHPKGMKEVNIDMEEIGHLACRKKVPLLIVPLDFT